MSLAEGEVIRDVRDPELAFRVTRYFRQTSSCDLVHGESLRDGQKVLLRAPRHDAAWNVAQIRERRDLADVEMHAMEAVCPHIPMPVALIHIDNPELTALDPALRDGEPIIVHRFVEGTPLPAWMAKHAPSGLSLERGLRVARVLAETLRAVHEHGFVMRGLRPEHVIIADDFEVHVVGFSRAAKKTERVSVLRPYYSEAYSAPEIAREISGKFVTPRADVYTFGAILSFVFSGENPTANPNAPYTRTAQERIAALPEGVGLLIAHCMQELHKKRFAGFDRILPLLSIDSLPVATTADFGTVALADAFGRRSERFGPVGHLSAGPLVSRPAGAGTAERAEAASNDVAEVAPLATPAAQRAARWVFVGGIALFVLLAVARIAQALRG